jgi:hypothetical protein
MGSLEYAQARISARFGDRPGELDWRRLAHVRLLPALFDVARNSAFRTWVGGISAQSTAHEIEARLRLLWRAHVAEVAAWVDDDWRGAVLWFGVLPELPIVGSLARREPVPAWALEDASYRDFVDGVAAARRAPQRRDTFAPLAGARGDPSRVGPLWRAEWERRVPSGGDTALLNELMRVGLSHLSAFRDPALTDGWPLRRTLESRLTLLYRRSLQDPAGVFVYLCLVALDVERLRGELLRRAAFAAPARVA